MAVPLVVSLGTIALLQSGRVNWLELLVKVSPRGNVYRTYHVSFLYVEPEEYDIPLLNDILLPLAPEQPLLLCS